MLMDSALYPRVQTRQRVPQTTVDEEVDPALAQECPVAGRKGS